MERFIQSFCMTCLLIQLKRKHMFKIFLKCLLQNYQKCVVDLQVQSNIKFCKSVLFEYEVNVCRYGCDNNNSNNNNMKYAYSLISNAVQWTSQKYQHAQHRFAQASGGSTNTTRVFHVLLLPSKHYKILHRVPYLLYGRRPGHS